MSHAYVEVDDVAVAGRILRGEGGGLDEKPNFGKKKERGSVLGKGRRARGVTVTRSGQEELMADVRIFPYLFRIFSSGDFWTRSCLVFPFGSALPSPHCSKFAALVFNFSVRC